MADHFGVSSQASMRHHSPSAATEIPSLVTTEQDPATLITYETNTGSSALANNVPTYMSWSGQSRAFIGGPPNSSTSSSMIPEALTDPGPPPEYNMHVVTESTADIIFQLFTTLYSKQSHHLYILSDRPRCHAFGTTRECPG
jgi:hypothetical protein